MAYTTNQPKRLKRVNVENQIYYFAMNVSKKRILELFQDDTTDLYFDHKPTRVPHLSKVTISTNSVWYDIDGNCIVSAD